MPWEIPKLPDLTPEHLHPVTIYGKSGGAQSYRSQLSVLPEHGIAVVMLTAGSMRALVPAVDTAARDQAKHEYARNFSKSACQVTDTTPQAEASEDVQIKIEQDCDSLVLSSVPPINGGNRTTELVSALEEIWNLTIGMYTGQAVELPIRLFPTGEAGETIFIAKRENTSKGRSVASLASSQHSG
ncbi:Beta-lactamase-like protein [Emericellopsis cladophorae]|uniref:Beta-lactamase-like protein n=1 Tax=Emericellopsis cladophorae TaxID=2686198 RepID=A0A9Q0BFD6_9HYPO|nr:Beta-lactamase-like protein [Emericellopsis cladophorae]KAI6782781.1 Beta-lactamase-like protein [Emericellopsis cladophorae]